MFGGWRYAGITAIQSGISLQPGLSVSNQGLASRPNATGQALSYPRTVAEWFNTAAFSAPAYGFFGNAGNGTITGPGLVTFDMALYKDFRITEHQTLEFRGELFNIFNHTNFSGVQTAYGSSNFGEVTSALDPRIVELRFVIIFKGMQAGIFWLAAAMPMAPLYACQLSPSQRQTYQIAVSPAAQFQERRAAFERTIHACPDDARLYAEFSSLLIASQEFSQSLPWIDKGLALAADDPVLHLRKGEALVALSRKKKL